MYVKILAMYVEILAMHVEILVKQVNVYFMFVTSLVVIIYHDCHIFCHFMTCLSHLLLFYDMFVTSFVVLCHVCYLFCFQKLELPVVTSEKGLEYVGDSNFCTYFILANFKGSEFEELHSAGGKILGRPALLSMAATEPPKLVHHNRPVYCHLMRANIMVFTGFRKKYEVVSAATFDNYYVHS